VYIRCAEKRHHERWWASRLKGRRDQGGNPMTNMFAPKIWRDKSPEIQDMIGIALDSNNSDIVTVSYYTSYNEK
jgi:hypothetical protein